jgi:putative transposase
MTRPYSEDLRERAVARFEAGETTRSIAVALRISPSCVSKWIKRKRETGSLAPGKIGGHKKPSLSGEPAEWLRERCRSGPFTTRGLAAELLARGIKTDRRAVWVFLRAEGLSFKKRMARPVRKRLVRGDLTGLRQRIRSRGPTPAKMEFRAPWSS